MVSPATTSTAEEEADTEDIQPETEEQAGALARTSLDSQASDNIEPELMDIDSAKTEFAVPKQTNSAFIIILILVALILGSGLAAMQFKQVRDWVRQNLPESLQRFVQ